MRQAIDDVGAGRAGLGGSRGGERQRNECASSGKDKTHGNSPKIQPLAYPKTACLPMNGAR
jgi:hypothetical protein